MCTKLNWMLLFNLNTCEQLVPWMLGRLRLKVSEDERVCWSILQIAGQMVCLYVCDYLQMSRYVGWSVIWFGVQMAVKRTIGQIWTEMWTRHSENCANVWAKLCKWVLGQYLEMQIFVTLMSKTAFARPYSRSTTH